LIRKIISEIITLSITVYNNTPIYCIRSIIRTTRVPYINIPCNSYASTNN